MSLGLSKRELRRERDRVLPYAQRTGTRAYSFVLNRRGEKVEVRVWPDGTAHYTPVDNDGRPVGLPDVDRRLVARAVDAVGVSGVVAGAVSAVGVLGLLVERLV